MYLVYPISPVISLVLALPTGLLVVRVFIIQHDCGHNSFFASPSANLFLGFMCSLITLTPFVCWARQHSLHHGSWSNLDRRKGTDLYSACLTVREFFSMSDWQRLLHRLPRHPLIANVLFPPLIFLLLYRLPFDTPRRWVRERRSVHVTNVALLGMFGALALVFGWQEVLTIHASIMVVASIVGVWLFSLQHRFETVRWTRRGAWDPSSASMEGSSWLRLPRLLNWLTGNIGFHHVHHLNSRIPNYNLEAAHDAVQKIWPVAPLSLRGGLNAPWLALWDEKTERLTSFRSAERAGA